MSVGGSLLDHGKTSHFIAFDLWNVFVQVPFRNFSAQILVWFSEKENEQEEGTEQKKMKMSGVMAVVCGLVLVIPVLCMILPLLSRADAGFARATEEITEYLQWHLATVLMKASVCHSGISLSVWTGIREYLQSSHGRHQSGISSGKCLYR